MNERNLWFTRLDSFVMTPRALIRNPLYKNIGSDEILIYSLMVDRMNLSLHNENFWFGAGVYIYYPVSEVASVLGCSEKKARSVLDNLQKAGLIIRVSQGQGRPAKIVPLRYKDITQ
jgi:hypothetical protein